MKFHRCLHPNNDEGTKAAVYNLAKQHRHAALAGPFYKIFKASTLIKYGLEAAGCSSKLEVSNKAGLLFKDISKEHKKRANCSSLFNCSL